MDWLDTRFADCLHHATHRRKPGEPFEPAIVNTTIYALPGEPQGTYQYARWANPTWTALEDVLSLLEDAETLIFPSGMAAVASVLYSQLRTGDQVLLPSDGYYTVRTAAEKFLAPIGVRVRTCPTSAVEREPLDGLKMVWVETPSNPGLDLADLRAVAQRAHAAGALLVVDNTTMTPLGQRPLELGADVLVSSDTKGVNGHSDALFGHVATRNAEVMAGVRDWRRVCGAIPGAFEAWLVQRGLDTLELRFARMCDNALELARRLAQHPKVHEVRYPGLAAHPAHQLACSQMRRFGSLVGITLASARAAEQFIDGCRYVRSATSFGGLHSSAERRARWGEAVAEGYVRFSVGCEPAGTLLEDVER
ncbi:MAG TPA: cystathionine gamma-lyase, partial [Burkholderiaceae bacterium]|nr:cystathionine gamma-lyase [Burkholderiaceae bacterium]